MYHAHIYFDLTQMATASKVRENIINDIPQLTYKGQLIPVSIGPHTKPMFEIHIPNEVINYAITSIDSLREELSVLIHPVQKDELEAHTSKAQWLGARLPLKLEALSI